MTRKIALIASLLFCISSYGANSVGEKVQQKFTTNFPTYTPGQWGNPSDHLTIAIRFIVSNVVLSAVSYNVMNDAYLAHSYADQKLQGSDLDRMGPKRNIANVDILTKSEKADTVSIFALQECSPVFIKILEEKLDQKYKWVQFESSPGKDFGVVAYDSSVLKVLNTKTARYSKGNEVKNYIMDLQMEIISNGAQFTFINTHTPFGCGPQLREYLLSLTTSQDKVLVMGDTNVGYNDTKPQSDIYRNLLDGLVGYKILQDPRVFSLVNSQQKIDLFDQVLARGIEIAYDKPMMERLRSNFTLFNKFNVDTPSSKPK